MDQDRHVQSWDEIANRFRSIGKHPTFATMEERMLHLIGVLRNEPSLQHFERWTSLLSIVFARSGRCVAVSWSEPGGIAWAGETGFHVSVVNYRDLSSSQDVFVDEEGVVAAVLERLNSTDIGREDT